MVKRKISALLLASAFAVGSFTTLDLAKPAPAQAAGWCLFDYSNNTWTMTLWNISCGSGGSVRPWIQYYRSDNDPRLYTAFGAWRTSGSTSASRPAGTLYSDAGYIVG